MTSEKLNAARAAAMRIKGQKWSKDEILNGIWDMYLEHCEMENKRDGTLSTRYPDFECALGQLEREGMAPNEKGQP